jgi:hypothetical protein
MVMNGNDYADLVDVLTGTLCQWRLTPDFSFYLDRYGQAVLAGNFPAFQVRFSAKSQFSGYLSELVRWLLFSGPGQARNQLSPETYCVCNFLVAHSHLDMSLLSTGVWFSTAGSVLSLDTTPYLVDVPHAAISQAGDKG